MSKKEIKVTIVLTYKADQSYYDVDPDGNPVEDFDALDAATIADWDKRWLDDGTISVYDILNWDVVEGPEATFEAVEVENG